MSLKKVLKSKLQIPQRSQMIDPSATDLENEEEDSGHHSNQDVQGIIQGSWSDSDERAVYEDQLSTLQEQFVAAMIENQALATELKDTKEANQVILSELESEQEKRHELQEELNKSRGMSSPGDLSGDWVDVGHAAQEETTAKIHLATKPSAWFNMLPERVVAAFYELIADFTEDAAPEPSAQEDEPLSVNRLKDNIKRFKSNSEPIFDSIRGVGAILQWKNPAATFVSFIIYMYSIYIGWFLPVVLFLLLFQLSVNYLTSKGWDLNIKYFNKRSPKKTKDGDSFSEMGVSDKFSVVVQVAKQVQNKLGHIADTLEKFKNLLMWKQPKATRNLFLLLLLIFIASCVLPGKTLFTVVGIALGIKCFIIEYIYVRFPRFKQRHDSVAQMWKELPTDKQLEEKYQRAAIHRHLVVPPQTNTSTLKEAEQEPDHQFCQIFNLPPSECPKRDWIGGRRCTLIDKDKGWTSAFVYGRLFLTQSFICFERLPATKKTISSNVLIPLKDVTHISKTRPVWFLPGPGMSIEINVSGFEKPHVFGALLNRDETYSNIISHAKKLELEWCKSIAADSSVESTVEGKESLLMSEMDQFDGGVCVRMSDLKEKEEKEEGDEEEIEKNLDLLVKI